VGRSGLIPELAWAPQSKNEEYFKKCVNGVTLSMNGPTHNENRDTRLQSPLIKYLKQPKKSVFVNDKALLKLIYLTYKRISERWNMSSPNWGLTMQ
jgi:hypothetical protein